METETEASGSVFDFGSVFGAGESGMARVGLEKSNVKGGAATRCVFGQVGIQCDTRPPCHTISCRQLFRRGVNDLPPTIPLSCRISKSIDRIASQELLGLWHPFFLRIIVESMVLSKTRSSNTIIFEHHCRRHDHCG